MTAAGQEERIQALEAEVRRLQVMLQCAPDFIARITNDGHFLYLNRMAPGFRREEVIGTSVDSYLPPESRERAHAAIRAALETRRVQQFSAAAPVAAERMGHYLMRVSPVIENDEVTSLVMIATDVSALEEQRISLQVAMDATGLGIWTYDPVSKAGSWDDTTRRIFGAVEATPERVLEDRLHPDDRRMVVDALERAQDSGRYGPLEHRIVRPGGEVRWVVGSGLPVRSPQGKVVGLVGSVQDITERRALEARLLEAEKLESIGRLAGGVAHDFNNMLTAILGNVDFAGHARSLAEVRPMLAEIRLTAERSAALTAQLLAFARRQVIAPQVVDPNTLIRRVDSLARRLLGEQIQVILDLAAQGHVRVDEGQLEQVLMNLVTNARDAMSGGGTLRVETSDVLVDPEHAARQPDVNAGRYVVITVADTGPGIAPTTLPHIFEPFYTTRAGGTGLGLATSYGIVKQSGGHIIVASEVRKGTTFRVYLPRVDAELSPTPPPPAVPRAANGERVLLVEDEPSVRAIAERALKRHGYHVRSAATGEEAVELAGFEPPFELLVTDVVLPGLSGRDLARQLTQRSPQLRVLFISGYNQNTIEQNGVLELGISFLQKPFLPIHLLVAVSKVLSSERSGHRTS